MITEVKVLNSESINRFAVELEKSPEVMLPYAQEFIQKVLFLLQEAIAPYPPASEANKPFRKNELGEYISYYERGKGSWRPVKRIKTLQAHLAKINGKPGRSLGRGVYATPGHEIAGYVLRPSSQQLGKNWTTQTYIEGFDVVGELSNPTSYGPYVQGFEQASFHADRGWVDLLEGVEKVETQIYQLADNLFERYLESLK